MKRAAIFLTLAWLLFFAGELTNSSLAALAAFFAYFLTLLAGGAALVIELLAALFRRCRWKITSAMAAALALALLPMAFMMEIREGVARAEDYFLRDARLAALETIRSENPHASHETIRLPETRKHLSEDGKIFLLKTDENYCAAAFWNFTGSQATVYCSDGNPPTEALLDTPEIRLCRPLGDGWYFAGFE